MPKKKRAFITGITGQDGSYLSEFLLKKGYEVGGLVRDLGNLGNVAHLQNQIIFYHGEICDLHAIAVAIRKFKPDEIYNLASQSSPIVSFNNPVDTLMATGAGAVNVFNAARDIMPKARIYQASTSELFGEPKKVPQNEHTPFAPANPYAAAKAYAHWMANVFRRDRNNPLFIACGILFNHESPRRGLNFVTRKITAGVACIKNKQSKGLPLGEFGKPIVRDGKLHLGFLGSKRDWGYAPDYVEAMWLMLQTDKPEDFVIATGEVHTVADICKAAFDVVGLDWKKFVITDPAFVPPVETGPLCGDSRKAKKELRWAPKTTFEELIKIMVLSDLKTFY